MSDFLGGMILGAGIAMYLLLVIVPTISSYIRRRRVLAEANRRLDAAEERLRRGWISKQEFRRGSNPPPSEVQPPRPWPRSPEDLQ